MISRRLGVLGTIALLVIALELFASAGSLGLSQVAARSSGAVPAASPDPTAFNLNITLSGAGASFPAPFLFNVTKEYHIQHPNVTITYGSVGSGAGQSAALNKT